MEFLLDIGAGALVALVYDIMRAIRHRSGRKSLGIVCDILFWLFACGVVLTVLFYTSHMELRAYEFFGILTGVFFYFSALSDLLQPFCEKITGIFYFFWKILFTTVSFSAIMIKNGFLCLTTPFRLLNRLLGRMAARLNRAHKEHQKQVKRI